MRLLGHHSSVLLLLLQSLLVASESTACEIGTPSFHLLQLLVEASVLVQLMYVKIET